MKQFDAVKAMIRSSSKIFKLFPCEFALCFIAFIIEFIKHIMEYKEFFNDYSTITAYPIFIAFVYFINILTHAKRFSYIYYIVGGMALLAFILPPSMMLIYAFGVFGEPTLTVFIILLSLIILSQKQKDNYKFMYGVIGYVESIMNGVIVALVSFGVMCAIIASMDMLFNIGSDLYEYSAMFNYLLLFPVIFFYNVYEKFIHGKKSKYRLLSFVVNYVFAPGTLLYSILLNIYTITILISGELPRASIAVMVFVLVIMVYFIKASFVVTGIKVNFLQKIYNRINYLLIPPIALFWFSVIQRIAEYNLTEARVYLVVFGAIMTLWVLYSFIRVTTKFYYLFFVIAFVGGLMTYIPYISAMDIAYRAHLKNIKPHIGHLSSDGIDNMNLFSQLNSEELQELISSLRYIHEDKYNKDSMVYNIPKSKIMRLLSNLGATAVYDENIIIGMYNNMNVVDINGRSKFVICFLYDRDVSEEYDRESDNYTISYKNKVIFKKKGIEIANIFIEKAGYSLDSLPKRNDHGDIGLNMVYEDKDIIVIFSKIALSIKWGKPTVDLINITCFFIKE